MSCIIATRSSTSAPKLSSIGAKMEDEGRGDLLVAQPPQELRERRAELGDEQR
ncbi:hypothetical protein Pcac1_g25784 [Phytophthora cactorum]|nr:hypothetical protein Pcac1_g25784 [Phytophthora cactorum]